MSGRTRFAAYALCREAQSVLLTRIWEHDPGAGRWTLPGGKIEWQETPQDAVLRELWEEAGLRGQIRRPLGIDTKVFPPWRHHDELFAVRFVFEVEATGTPRVMEEGGSTTDARWVAIGNIGELQTTTLVHAALGFR